MIDLAYAMAPQGGAGQDGSALIQSLIPMFVIFGIFYFLLIRPQQKKAREHREMLDSIKKGDAVLTQGGIYGRVTSIQDQIVTLEIADKVRVRVSRSAVAGLETAAGSAEQNPKE